MSDLLSGISLRGVQFANRVGMAPMCMFSCAPDGLPTQWHTVHLGSRAIGGCGLILTEATAVEPRGRISDRDTGIWNDQQLAAWRPTTEFARSLGCPIGIQLAHAGRKSRTDGARDGANPAIAPSALPFSHESPTPVAMSPEIIEECLTSWRAAAVRSVEAGFSFIELHMAHGYLLSAFLSPISNRRKDAYGGGFEGRIRFPVEVVRAIRGSIPASMPLFVRINAVDHLDDGWQLDDSVLFARVLKHEGVDLIDCSSGGITAEAAPPVPARAEQGYQAEYARIIKHDAQIPTAAVGGISDCAFANELVKNGASDFVFLGRTLLREPNWGLRAAKQLVGDAGVCPQYERAYK